MHDLELPALYRANRLFLTDRDFEDAREIRQESGRIISAASAIERVVAEIISDTMFKEVLEHREIILGSFLSSDWCSFSAKRKLLNVALELFHLTDKKVKKNIYDNLGKVMKYRNAFAHGTLGLNSETFQQELHYFDEEPKISALDDEYFLKLEKTFKEVWEQLTKIQANLKKTEK